MQHLIFILRLILACVCGGAIGLERTNRGKGAGIRTHIIVAVAAALMMLVSKYGFTDIEGLVGLRGADPARIAAQVISGVGFLGAGMIYFNRHTIKGLTTAAGIWATAGVGIALGSGMYIIGIASTFLIVILQVFLHKNFKILRTPSEEKLNIVLEDTDEAYNLLTKTLEKYEMTITSLKCTRTEEGLVTYEIIVVMPDEFDLALVLNDFRENKCMISVDI